MEGTTFQFNLILSVLSYFNEFFVLNQVFWLFQSSYIFRGERQISTGTIKHYSIAGSTSPTLWTPANIRSAKSAVAFRSQLNTHRSWTHFLQKTSVWAFHWTIPRNFFAQRLSLVVTIDWWSWRYGSFKIRLHLHVIWCAARYLRTVMISIQRRRIEWTQMYSRVKQRCI